MLEAVTFVNQIFRNFGWNDSVKSFFCIVGTSWMGWGRVEWYWHTGMSYLTSLNTQLFKNIAYVGSFGHILFNLIFNVNSNLAESSANCSAQCMYSLRSYPADQSARNISIDWTSGCFYRLIRSVPFLTVALVNRGFGWDSGRSHGGCWCSHQGSRPIGVSCTSESSQLVFVQGSAIPNRHPTPSLSSQYLTDRDGKMPETPINVPRSNPKDTQRPSKCLKATQTLKFEFDKKIRLLLI